MNSKIKKIVGITLTFLVFATAMIVMVPQNTIATNQPPVAHVYPKYQEVSVGEEAWFYGNDSYDPDGYITYYIWDFGDGNYGSGDITSHVYSSPGHYVVWLTVYDNENATDRDYANVTVLPGNDTNEPPVAAAYPKYQTVDVGDDAWFYGGYSYDPDGYIISWEWKFGDGSFGSGINTSHSYTMPGIYTVLLTVIDNLKATDTDNCTVEVLNDTYNEPPVAVAEPDHQTVNVGEDAWFSANLSYDPDGFIVSYGWDFGDGNIGSGVYVTHPYTAPGIYNVILVVRDDDGAMDSDNCTVVVEDQFPEPPTDLDAILVPGSLEDVRLTWAASADDGAGDDDVTSYEIYRADSVDGPFVFVDSISADDSSTYSWTDFGKGDLDWNNYFYIVRAKDIFDNEEQNNNKVGKFAWYLKEGWNMFSVPLVQSDTSRETVLQTIENNYVTVQGYHAGKSRPWLHWHRWKPNYFNDEIEINHKKGYYIDMIVPDYLVTAGKVASQTDIHLKNGWNLIGYPCLSEQTVSDALSSIDAKYNLVEYFDPIKDKEVRLESNDLMIPGFGFWVHTTAECVLTITN
ncbi:MAG: PKD domain-containing protein [Thermoplasmata archaeon]|nr:MAG: PKD domain-containing protein [Thermoplasmata archaeon]